MKTVGKKSFNVKKHIKFEIEKIIENALNMHATDVHIEPREELVLVRFRIHGILHIISKLPIEYLNDIVKYFKFLGNLNFEEKHFPQMATISYGKANIRISITPIMNGDKITLRLMRARPSVRKLDQIGLWGENLRSVKKALRMPRGIIFTVGDGKNTTNFALLDFLNTAEKNIVTVEKQIEKRIATINQTQINSKIGLSYSLSVKSALSQNPDVILVDNVKDKETAELIFNASMNGKLIIASLPVHKSTDVIPFLNFLGVEPFLISTNTLAIIGQSLIRTINPKFSTLKKISPTESKVLLNEFNISIDKLHHLEKQYKEELDSKVAMASSLSNVTQIPSIKNQNNYLYYTGTTSLFEVISLIDERNNSLKNLINIRPSSSDIEELLLDQKFTTLKQDGLIKALNNETTIGEVLRRTGF